MVIPKYTSSMQYGKSGKEGKKEFCEIFVYVVYHVPGSHEEARVVNHQATPYYNRNY